MNILISNRQKAGRPDIPRIRRLTLFFMNQARRNNPRRRWWGDLSLVLTDDAGIIRINRLYLDREDATDVISFAWPSVPCGTRGCGGELFINVQRALAVGHGDIDRELALYIAHACDHASGASDRSPPGRRRMRTRERGWLKEAAKQNLLNGLLEIR